MFDSTSRYDKIPTATVNTALPGGIQRLVTYKRRRFLPDPSTLTVLVRHTTAEGERLDTIASRYLGDPTQFWRICDANGVMRPEDLENHPGTTVDISAAGPV